MHELSIASSIVELGEEEASQRGNVRVEAIYIRVGPLSGVDKNALLSSWDLACERTVLEGTRLIIEDVPVLVYCPACRTNRTLNSIQWFSCPECGTPTSDVILGKELQVVAMEILE